MKGGESKQNLLQNSLEDIIDTINPASGSINLNDPAEKPLGPVEKTFLLHAERGDCATVRRLIKEYANHPEELDLNCVDPLNRSALIAAIENENIELIRLLLEENIKVKDGLLHAIKEEYVEAVEMLLHYEEEHHKPGEPYSWEAVDRSSSTFTSDITPLILASHKNNYEIIKILLDRGATLPMPHDVRCGCDECVDSSTVDSLRHSQARINAYRALTASSLISLSSKDPLLTAFELSWELRRLSRMETEFRADYNDMRSSVQTFATALLDHARTSYELEIMLNYDIDGDTWEPGERQTLERLKLAIKYKQKMFVAHPSVQQLLAAIWYEGLPGFRRKSLIGQLIQVGKLGTMFPVYCTIYMVAPESKMGLFMKKPFVKFICYSSSYAFFLMLLGAASQRVEIIALEWFGPDWVQEIVQEWKRKERGAGPGVAECGVVIYMISLIWGEIRSLWSDGIMEYISDLWNIVDFITNVFYVMWLSLRMSAFYIVWREASQGRDPWYPREQWHSFDPMLLSEGAFAAGMIFSFLKLVHIFSVNPHLGPLQISLGRMIIDIIKFFFIYTLVLFAFGCGLNQLLWYYAELEKNKCYHLPTGLPDFDNAEKSCTIWRRYANLFETSQSLFWASFGLVDLVSFELAGIKGFTRFWALLMFGSYSVINVIVLLNMLIAMMSNSYQIISERSDSEWKFARSKLWISYFDDGDTLPPPFNVFPRPKMFLKMLGCVKSERKTHSFKRKTKENARDRHERVMRLLVRRYVTAEQRKRDDFGITEDDVMEIRQDISTLRYELIDILRQNGMKTPKVSTNDTQLSGKKGKVMERRLLKDFHIGIVEAAVSEAVTSSKEPKDIFGQLAKVIGKRTSNRSKKKDWNAMVRHNTAVKDPIGTAQEAENNKRNRQSLRRHILDKSESIDQDKLLEYNPKLSEVPRGARLAYAKFMTKKMQHELTEETENETAATRSVKSLKISPRPTVKFKGSGINAIDSTDMNGPTAKKETEGAPKNMEPQGEKRGVIPSIRKIEGVIQKDQKLKRDAPGVPEVSIKVEVGKSPSPQKAELKTQDAGKASSVLALLKQDSKDVQKDAKKEEPKPSPAKDDKKIDVNKKEESKTDKDKALKPSDCKEIIKPAVKSEEKSEVKPTPKPEENPAVKSDSKTETISLVKPDDAKTESKVTDKIDKEEATSKSDQKPLKDDKTKADEAKSSVPTLKVEDTSAIPKGKSKLSGQVRTGWI